MPAAMIPIAMIASAGLSTTGQLLSNRSQSKAYEKQLQGERYSLDSQLALERERAAEEKRRYDAEQSARAPYEKLRMGALEALLKSYGIDAGGSLAQLASGGGGAAQMPTGHPSSQPMQGQGQGQGPMSMASLARPQGGGAPQFQSVGTPQYSMRDIAQLQAMMPVQQLQVGQQPRV